jgi:FOG: Glucan-binding domain (YG repeat)
MKSSRLKKLIAVTVATLTLTALSPIGASAAWKQDSNGWWNTEGNSYSTGWRSINGNWYYFDSIGYMKTGWVNDEGTWYYMQPSGEMRTGWVNDGGTWYYMQPSGAMKTGWVNDGGTWYYMQSSGAMKTGWVNDGGTWYYMQSSGAMKTGWINDGGTWYFAASSGAMQTGVVEVDGKVYYFASNGAMTIGSVTIDGTTYTFDSTGAATGDKIPTTDKIFNGNGSAVTQGTQNPTDVVDTDSGHHGGGGGSSSSYLSDLNDGGSHTGNYTISTTTGTFGGSNESSTTTINGNISINAYATETGIITLQNLKINGKLTIDFGAGTVILDNVSVNGVDVSNVGPNSLHVKGNSSITNLNVSDKNNDAHIVVEGDAAKIKNTAISSGAVLAGKFDNVSINTASTVELQSGSIGTVLVKGTAAGAKFIIGSGTTVADLDVNAHIDVTGTGTIANAILRVSGTTIETKPTKIVLAPGVTATINGEKVYEFQKDINNKYTDYAKININTISSSNGKVIFTVSFDKPEDSEIGGNVDYVTRDILVTNANGTDEGIEYNNGEYTAPIDSIVYSTVRVYRDGQVGYVTSDPTPVQ